jgi:hypothetical protein
MTYGIIYCFPLSRKKTTQPSNKERRFRLRYPRRRRSIEIAKPSWGSPRADDRCGPAGYHRYTWPGRAAAIGRLEYVPVVAAVAPPLPARIHAPSRRVQAGGSGDSVWDHRPVPRPSPMGPSARRVLPMAPWPTSVSSRQPGSARLAAIWPNSATRPTNEVGSAGGAGCAGVVGVLSSIAGERVSAGYSPRARAKKAARSLAGTSRQSANRSASYCDGWR